MEWNFLTLNCFARHNNPSRATKGKTAKETGNVTVKRATVSIIVRWKCDHLIQLRMTHLILPSLRSKTRIGTRQVQ